MDPSDVIAPLTFITFVAITAVTFVKVARLRAARTGSLPADATARIEALERTVESLQHDLVDTQERLDFAERMLGKAREERRLGGS